MATQSQRRPSPAPPQSGFSRPVTSSTSPRSSPRANSTWRAASRSRPARRVAARSSLMEGAAGVLASLRGTNHRPHRSRASASSTSSSAYSGCRERMPTSLNARAVRQSRAPSSKRCAMVSRRPRYADRGLGGRHVHHLRPPTGSRSIGARPSLRNGSGGRPEGKSGLPDRAGRRRQSEIAVRETLDETTTAEPAVRAGGAIVRMGV